MVYYGYCLVCKKTFDTRELWDKHIQHNWLCRRYYDNLVKKLMKD